MTVGSVTIAEWPHNNLGAMMTDENVSRLHACFDKESGKVFYVSMVDRRGVNASLRTSRELKKGMQLVMMPVPDNWDGKEMDPDFIQKSEHSFNATVSRIEGRGAFQIRILSSLERNLLDRYRAGKGGLPLLDTEMITAGMVTTIKVEGNLTLETTAQLQATIRKSPEDHPLLLLDFTKLISIARAAVGVLSMLLKEETKNHRRFAFLTISGSEVENALLDSKITTLFHVFTNRDEAVASLLQETLD